MEPTTFKFSQRMDGMTFFCGMDIHKYQLEVAIYGKDDALHEFTKGGVFSADIKGLKMIWGFIEKYQPVKIGMEATNVYHHQVATFLEDMKQGAPWSYEILIIPTADAAGLPGKSKTDRIDAQRIAKYIAAGLLKSGKPIIVTMEDLREIFRSAARLERDMTALKNRIKKSMDRGGFRPVEFNLNLDWTRDFVYHLSGHDGTVGDFVQHCEEPSHPLAKRWTMIAKNMAKFEPYLDVVLSPGQKALIRQDVVELEFKKARKALLAVEIDHIIALRPGLRQLIENLASIPGLSPFSAAWLVVETGPVARYPTVREYLSYCGCSPRTLQSAGTVYSSHVSRRSNKFTRYIFRNAAKVVCDVLQEPSNLKTYATKIDAKKRFRGGKLVYSIVAAKIARITFGIMRNGTSFSPDLATDSHPTAKFGNGFLTLSNRKALVKARNCLKRLGSMKELKALSKKAARIAEELDKALREN